MAKNKKINMEEVNDFLAGCNENTKIYLGCDSQVSYRKGKRRVATYTTAIVVHVDGNHGGKLFYETSVEPDYAPDRRKPEMRLMNEVYKVSAMYLRLMEEAENAILMETEVHLDINVDKAYKSSAIVKEAIGYVQGVCQVDPKVKPEAFAASTVADAHN